MYKKLFINLFLIFALTLSGCGRKKSSGKADKLPHTPVSHRETEIAEEPTEKPPQIISYIVSLSGKTLSLYEVDGEIKKTVASMEIDPDFYPADDIKKLTDGITVPYKEDGYEILENFAN